MGISRIITQVAMVTLNRFKPSVIKKVAPSFRFVILTSTNQHQVFHNLDYPPLEKENRRKRKNMTHDFSTFIFSKKWIRLTLRFQKICTENIQQIKPTQVLEDKKMEHKRNENCHFYSFQNNQKVSSLRENDASKFIKERFIKGHKRGFIF